MIDAWWNTLNPHAEWIALGGVVLLAALLGWRRRAASSAAPRRPKRPGRRPAPAPAGATPMRAPLVRDLGEATDERVVAPLVGGRSSRGGPRVLDPDQVVDVLRRLGASREQGSLLQEFAEVLGGDFGFERVVVRVHNARTRLYEARAFFGLDGPGIAQVSTHDLGEEEFEGLVRQARRVRGGWRLPAQVGGWPDRLPPDSVHLGGEHDGNGRPAVGWDPTRLHRREMGAVPAGDDLVLLLLDPGERVVGYASAALGEEAEACDENVLGQLQVVAHLVAAELRQVRLRSVLQRRDLEYAIVSEQLREWQGMRDNFVANVSHELRTPLTSVKAYAETLARGLSDMDTATAQEFAHVIEHEADRLEQVFDDLLDVAHLEGRGRRVARDRIDLRRLVTDVAEQWRGRFKAQDLGLHTDATAAPLWMQGDADGIRQVIDHLLSNALKFTPTGGTVTLRTEEEAGTVQLSVEDSGIGIPEAERLRIFERFYQVDGSATRMFGGQGLGLALCREIVGWHHGRIWVEDGARGGSRFVVHLPVRGLVVRQRPDDEGADSSERLQWEAFLQLAIHLVSEMTGTRVTSVMLVDEIQDVLRIEAAVGLDEDVVQNTMIGRGEAVAGVVWRDELSVLVPDLDADERFRHLADDVTYRPRSLLSVPLRRGGEVVGVLNVNTKLDGRPFDEDDRLLLEALAERIMLAVDSFERFRAGYRRLSSVESGVRAMLDVGRERRTRVREQLARIGVDTGRRLGLDEEHLRALSYALRTYDLGLSRVSSQILRKPTPLNADERNRIEDHTRLGAELVAELEPSPRVRKMILHHHENVDGSGYPDGLRGEAIPVGARIVRLVDAFSALLHDRPFREALTLAEARQLLRDGVDRRFCPRVTPVFLEVVEGDLEELETLLRARTGSAPDPSSAPMTVDLPSTS